MEKVLYFLIILLGIKCLLYCEKVKQINAFSESHDKNSGLSTNFLIALVFVVDNILVTISKTKPCFLKM
jgi:hypothetical protein